MPDARFENHGSLILVHPLTPAAVDWIGANVHPERTYWGKALVVEPRYAYALAMGMKDAGLEVE